MNEELIFCPLGGAGEIGMNMSLYSYVKDDLQKWIYTIKPLNYFYQKVY